MWGKIDNVLNKKYYKIDDTTDACTYDIVISRGTLLQCTNNPQATLEHGDKHITKIYKSYHGYRHIKYR